MKNGSMKSLMTGMLLGGAAATIYGVMNWQTERKWNQKMRQGGEWIVQKKDQMMKKL